MMKGLADDCIFVVRQLSLTPTKQQIYNRFHLYLVTIIITDEERKCVCVCVCVREREREREYQIASTLNTFFLILYIIACHSLRDSLQNPKYM